MCRHPIFCVGLPVRFSTSALSQPKGRVLGMLFRGATASLLRRRRTSRRVDLSSAVARPATCLGSCRYSVQAPVDCVVLGSRANRRYWVFTKTFCRLLQIAHIPAGFVCWGGRGCFAPDILQWMRPRAGDYSVPVRTPQ